MPAGLPLDADLFASLQRWPYTVFTAVLDKHSFRERQPAGRPEAYAHVLGAIVRRYAAWLAERGGRGDVMVEARGGQDDRRLKDAYTALLDDSSADTIVAADTLTSRQLKVRTKSRAVPGLQLADLLAHPSAGALQARHGHGRRPTNFGGRVADLLLRSKHGRLSDGRIDGTGLLWIPEP